MKKILFAAVAFVAMSFVACNENKTEAPVVEGDSIEVADSMAQDSLNVDSVADSAAVVDSAAQAQ